MQETKTTTQVAIPDLGAVRAGAIARREVPEGFQIRTCALCGRKTRFVPDDPAGGWYTCTGCGRFA